MLQANAAPLARWTVGSAVYSVVVSHDGARIASGSHDGYVHVWDVHTGALVLGPLMGHTGLVNSVAFCPNDDRIVSGSHDKTIRIWSGRTGTPSGEPLRGHADGVRSVAFSSDSTRIVSGSLDKTIRMWDSYTGKPLGKPLKGHTTTVTSAAFSHDSTRIVSGSDDCTIRIWDTRTGAPVGKPLKGHTSYVNSVAFSHDSTRIVSGSYDYSIRVWDACTGALIGKPLKGHADQLKSVAFSLDDTRIVSGSEDRTVRVWDVRTGAPIGEPLMGHTYHVNSAVFSPDSSRIVSGSTDGTICVWQAPWAVFPFNIPSPSFDMVTSKMSTQEIFDCLVNHGCADLTLSIDPTRHSSSAIASGGFGDVWQAYLRNGTLVAIKCLRLHVILEGDEKGMKRMARELHNWSKARHENVQELLGIITFQDRLGMVSLWMSNGNLQQYIERNPSVDRYRLCVQLAKGVAYLHGIGMVHGDIQALNILVSAEGIVKISDFDYSILAESTLRFSETTKSGGGTVRWMAPELLIHREDDDSPPVTRNTKTDVYALGMTMLETISGKVPYHQYTYDVGIIRALDRKEPPRRPQELSGSDERSTGVWNLLLTCWDHDPLARPDASSVLESLQSFAA